MVMARYLLRQSYPSLDAGASAPTLREDLDARLDRLGVPGRQPPRLRQAVLLRSPRGFASSRPPESAWKRKGPHDREDHGAILSGPERKEFEPRGPSPFEVALVDTEERPADQRIATKALHLRELGLSDRVIAQRLGVSDKTVGKAIRWLPGRSP